MFKLLMLILVCASFSLGAMKQSEIAEAQKNHFITHGIPSFTNLSTIDVTTGNYREKEIDLVVTGIEPISLQRFYFTELYDPRYGAWIYNPETYALANFELPGKPQLVIAGERTGQIHRYEKSADYRYEKLIKGTYLFDPIKQKICSTSDGQSHPLNTKILFQRENEWCFNYEGEIVDGCGRIRRFTTPTHCWVQSKTFAPERDPKTDKILPEVKLVASEWTPYQLLITEEKQPNGNILCYTYQLWKDEKVFPLFRLLKSITAYNSSKTKILGYIHLNYQQESEGNVRNFTAEGSDGRKVTFTQGGNPQILISASSFHNPPVAYYYNDTLLHKIEKPQGNLLITNYYPQTNKVKSQLAPVGLEGELEEIHRYKYHEKSTEVYDAKNNKTIYRFDENKRITSIEIYDGTLLYSITKNQWDVKTGNLLVKTIEDAQGRTYLKQTFTYDENQNPIQESIGDNTSTYTTYRTYSKDGFNLKLAEWDDFGKKITFSYRPNTNLLEHQFVWEKEVIQARTFYVYDDCAVCIRQIVDDGVSENPEDLTRVTYRKIIVTHPKQSLPCLGLPEIVEEKTIDFQGKEILLHKTRYAYTSFGKVSKEEHFDSTGASRYVVAYDYDVKERLIATADALGNRTTFFYDQNFNLTDVRGPRGDMHKKITYDKANRPVRVDEKQSDKSFLSTQKIYDQCNRIVATIDECGQKTTYAYDVLGRNIKITYPNGTFEEKGYDILGNLILEKDALGYMTRKSYDFRGNIIEILYPDGSEEHFSYNPNGTLAAYSSRNGAKTLFSYDVFNHPIEEVTYSSSGEHLKTVSSTWSPFRLLSTTEGEKKTVYYNYDFAGRKVEERMEEKVIRYAYDELGRLTKTIQGDTITSHAYDYLNHLIEMRVETGSGKLIRKEQYAYDAAGNKTHTITQKGIIETVYNTRGLPLVQKDPLGHKTIFTYTYKGQFVKTTIFPNGLQLAVIHDMFGRPIEQQTKNGKSDLLQQFEMQYDANGNLIQRVDSIFVGTTPQGTITHSWEYGPCNQLIRTLEAGIKETLYTYDGRGRLKTIIKPDKSTLNRTYDDLGRLIHYFSSDFDYRYAYDANDRVIAIHDAVSQTSTKMNYDIYGNLTHELLANELHMNYGYDPYGHRISNKLPDGSVISYSYQGNDLYQVSRKGIVHIYQERDLDGLPTVMKLPGNLGIFSIDRDPLSRWKKASSFFYSAQFPEMAYDEVGNLLTYKFSDALGTHEECYAYDELNQLIKENTHTYVYDSLYNRIQKDENSYTINALGQTTHDGDHNYIYDPNGNLISNGERSFAYDTQNRLISVNDGTQKIEYAYDPFHRRLSKKTFIDDKLQNAVYYLWDKALEIGIVDNKKKFVELRVFGEAAVFYELNGKIYVPIYDHRGAVVALADHAKKSRHETYHYTAFGEEISTVRYSPWLFAGKRLDLETGFLYWDNRYYSPNLGHWITMNSDNVFKEAGLYFRQSSI